MSTSSTAASASASTSLIHNKKSHKNVIGTSTVTQTQTQTQTQIQGGQQSPLEQSAGTTASVHHAYLSIMDVTPSLSVNALVHESITACQSLCVVSEVMNGLIHASSILIQQREMERRANLCVCHETLIAALSQLSNHLIDLDANVAATGFDAAASTAQHADDYDEHSVELHWTNDVEPAICTIDEWSRNIIPFPIPMATQSVTATTTTGTRLLLSSSSPPSSSLPSLPSPVIASAYLSSSSSSSGFIPSVAASSSSSSSFSSTPSPSLLHKVSLNATKTQTSPRFHQLPTEQQQSQQQQHQQHTAHLQTNSEPLKNKKDKQHHPQPQPMNTQIAISNNSNKMTAVHANPKPHSSGMTTPSVSKVNKVKASTATPASLSTKRTGTGTSTSTDARQHLILAMEKKLTIDVKPGASVTVLQSLPTTSKHLATPQQHNGSQVHAFSAFGSQKIPAARRTIREAGTKNDTSDITTTTTSLTHGQARVDSETWNSTISKQGTEAVMTTEADQTTETPPKIKQQSRTATVVKEQPHNQTQILTQIQAQKQAQRHQQTKQLIAETAILSGEPLQRSGPTGKASSLLSTVAQPYSHPPRSVAVSPHPQHVKQQPSSVVNSAGPRSLGKEADKMIHRTAEESATSRKAAVLGTTSPTSTVPFIASSLIALLQPAPGVTLITTDGMRSGGDLNNKQRAISTTTTTSNATNNNSNNSNHLGHSQSSDSWNKHVKQMSRAAYIAWIESSNNQPEEHINSNSSQVYSPRKNNRALVSPRTATSRRDNDGEEEKRQITLNPTTTVPAPLVSPSVSHGNSNNKPSSSNSHHSLHPSFDSLIRSDPQWGQNQPHHHQQQQQHSDTDDTDKLHTSLRHTQTQPLKLPQAHSTAQGTARLLHTAKRHGMTLRQKADNTETST